MCMSPHEMTSARLEDEIKDFRDWLEKLGDSPHQVSSKRWAERQIKKFEAELKYRAENGSYHADTDPTTGDKRY